MERIASPVGRCGFGPMIIIARARPSIRRVRKKNEIFPFGPNAISVMVRFDVITIPPPSHTRATPSHPDSRKYYYRNVAPSLLLFNSFPGPKRPYYATSRSITVLRDIWIIDHSETFKPRALYETYRRLAVARHRENVREFLLAVRNALFNTRVRA